MLLAEAFAFNGARFPTTTTSSSVSIKKSSSLFPQPRAMTENQRTTSLAASAAALNAPRTKNSGGGEFLKFKTKYGYLNPFAIYYGATSILLGIPWFIALNLCQLFYTITGNKIDKLKRLPNFVSQIWGESLMKLTRSTPVIEGQEILDKLEKENRAVMFCANHSAFSDIPFIGVSLGSKRNYKFVAKAELAKVPILGRSIKVGGHVMVDRSSRKSQLLTLKSGMQWLKDGVNLITFPEGTRSRTGRVQEFKNGAFKMAHKVGAPVVPVSIVGAFKVNPDTWFFPKKAARGNCKVVVHEPIESTGLSEEELADKVREAIIRGLPGDQRPLDGAILA